MHVAVAKVFPNKYSKSFWSEYFQRVIIVAVAKVIQNKLWQSLQSEY